MGGQARAPNKELRELIRKVEKQGCIVERTKSGHYRVSKPGNLPTVVFSGTSMAKGTWLKQLKMLRTLLSVEV